MSVRLDLNIPISENGQILDDTRIRERNFNRLSFRTKY
ncbi:MAG: hypothetical protein Ct9H90mP2_01530 [Dehalococcoidia bacterium]|nr:MAG: hypothetical protein Ct9H90mP2_01530 [Dehalococcoidia bacterium]